jgi:transposase
MLAVFGRRRGFRHLQRRRVVERTFAWMSRYRRMSRDYEDEPLAPLCTEGAVSLLSDLKYT